MNLRRSSVLALFVLSLAGAAHASPPAAPAPHAPAAAPAAHVPGAPASHPLAQAAIEHHEADAAKTLGAARTSAAQVRAAAADHDAIHAAETKAVRHDIAKGIVLARRDLRANAATLNEKREAHAAATASVAKLGEETKTAAAAVAKSEGSVSWFARKTGLSFSSTTRENLARLADEKSTHAALAGRLGEEEQKVAELAADVKTFEKDRAALSQTLATQRQRAGGYKAEANAQTEAKVASLRAEADKIEADAKAAIHGRVKSWVDAQLAAKRQPIAAAHGESARVLSEANSVDGRISSAHSAVSNLSSVMARREADKALASVVGENGLTQAVATLDDFSLQSASSDAQSRLGDVNGALQNLGARVNGLKQMVARLDSSAGANTLSGQVTRVDTDLATLAFVDVVLDLAHLESPLTHLGLTFAQVGNVSNASSELYSASSNVAQIRSAVSAIHHDLGGALARLDGEAAKVVDETVTHLVAKH